MSTVSPPIKVHSPAAAIAIKVNVKNGQLLEIHDTLIVASVERPQGIAFVETRQREILRDRILQPD